MLRLLFCSAALLPIAIVPWMNSDAGTIATATSGNHDQPSYAEAIRAPAIDALEACEASDLPVFFHDGLVTSHSAEYIQRGLQTAAECGGYDMTIVPVLPEEADGDERAESIARTAELRELVRLSDETGADLTVAKTMESDDVPTLYINGRSAFLRIEPVPAQ